MNEPRRIASIDEGVTFRWLGVSSFEITHAGRVLLIDPFLSRPDDAEPPPAAAALRPEQADAILVTHGHADHFGDVPALARRLDAVVYLPGDAQRERWFHRRLFSGASDPGRWRSWRTHRRVELGGLIVQAYPVHREELPTRWIPRAAAAALRGRLTPRILAQALRLTLTFPLAETFGLHVTHAATGASFFFLGGLTRQVYDLPERPLPVDAVFLPLVETSEWWLDDAIGLVSLLRPRVVVVHHHDDWYPPLTRPADVGAFRRAVEERCGVPVFEPSFARPFTLGDLLAEARRASNRPSEPPCGRASPA